MGNNQRGALIVQSIGGGGLPACVAPKSRSTLETSPVSTVPFASTSAGTNEVRPLSTVRQSRKSPLEGEISAE